MKTIEEEKKQAFDNAAITLAIGCMPIDESILPFELGFYAGVEFAERWIPVEEELPKIGSSVLVKLDYTEYSKPIRILLADVNYSEKRIEYGGPNSLTGHGYLYGLYFSLPSIVKPGIVTHWRPINHK